MSAVRVVSSNLRHIDNTFIRNLRDQRKRQSAKEFEVQRRAYLFVARNTSLPATIRHKAQLGLNALNNGEGRLNAVKNRCVETGKGRGERGSIYCGCWPPALGNRSPRLMAIGLRRHFKIRIESSMLTDFILRTLVGS